MVFKYKHLRNTGNSSKGLSLCNDGLIQSDESETRSIFLKAEATNSRVFEHKLLEASENRSKAFPLSVVHCVDFRSYYFVYVLNCYPHSLSVFASLCDAAPNPISSPFLCWNYVEL